MKWYQDTKVEETWVFDKKKDKMVLSNRKVIRQGDTKLVKANLKISKVK